ncbi:MAG: hypothetical protein KIT58_09515 [Planctomycetota bacterium]|nr:hypothetical protein [Planctomycetota bacterium]
MAWLVPVLALHVAVALTLVFVAALGWQRPGEQGTRTGWGEATLPFFVLLLLVTWALGLWLAPVATGGGWPVMALTFLGIGLVAALALAALLPRTGWRSPTVGPVASPAVESAEASASMSALFWVLALALAGVVALGYLT